MEAAFRRKKKRGVVRESWTLTKPVKEITVNDVFRADGYFEGRISFGTAPSWQAVGTAYSARVQKALADADFPAELPAWVVADNPRATAVRILNEMNRRIRYTGLYLGDKGVTPTAVNEVLKRGYGDCKDKATLLVGMLRDVGLAADVALVNSIRGGVNPDTPGLGAFDHAIVVVRLENGTDLWLDPTVELNRDGTLPFDLHNSPALIASAENAALVTIPGPDPADHGMIARWDFYPAAVGQGRAVARYEGRGNKEIEFRQHHREVQHQKKKDDTVEETHQVDPADLSQPWAREITIEPTDKIAVQFNFAQITVPLFWITEEIPFFLNFEAEETLVPVAVTGAGTYRMAFEIHDLPGFEVAAPFPRIDYTSTHFSMKAATLAEDPNRGEILLTFKAGRYPLEEVTQIHGWLQDLKTMNFTQTYQHRGLKLLEKGDIKEAFAILLKEKQTLNNTTTHLRLAQGFSTLGMLEPALGMVEAGLALQHEPEEVLKALSLFNVNFLGKELGPGFHRARVLAVLDRSIKRHPDNNLLKVYRAYVADHQDGGVLITEPATLKKNAQNYKLIPFANYGATYKNHVLVNHLLAGNLDAVGTIYRDMQGKDLEHINLILISQRRGVQAAIEEAGRIADPKKRLAALIHASDLVSRMRDYPAAVRFLEEVPETQQEDGLKMRLAILRETQPVDITAYPEEDPRTPLYRLFANGIALAEGSRPFEAHEMGIEGAFLGLNDLEALRYGLRLASQTQYGNNQQNIWDTVSSNMRFEFLDGDAKAGDRNLLISITLPTFGLQEPNTYWVTRTKRGYRIVTRMDSVWHFADGLAYLLDNKQKKEAVRLIDVATAKENAGRWPRIGKSLIRKIWTLFKTHDRRPEQLFAMVFGLTAESPPKRLARLETALAKAADEQVVDYLTMSVATMWAENEQHERALSIYKPHYEQHTDARNALTLLRRLEQAGRFTEHDELLAAWLGKEDNSYPFQRHQMVYLRGKGDMAGYQQLLKMLAEHPQGRKETVDNTLAWYALFEDVIPLSEAVTVAERRVGTADPGKGQMHISSESFHTLATLYATTGRYVNAVETLRKTALAGRRFRPEGVDFYVLGFIAQQLNFPDIARTYYARVPQDLEDPLDTGHLVQRRTAELDAAVLMP
ncbi:TGc domain-containing protein [Acanthopleuribacter pedis]